MFGVRDERGTMATVERIKIEAREEPTTESIRVRGVEEVGHCFRDAPGVRQ